ncbi:MAG: pyridoxamine 5'-phosphate oxidase family protein [Chitinophagaceae bacterium]|nr:pyridoxamine 5'-phosphate oxidase family protein [Chitinophagaceae bacterium]
MDEIIKQFIGEQNCASICCVDESRQPYCFSCFYAFNAEVGLLYFKSSSNSRHAALMKINPFVAGTILPDKLNKMSIKGVQLKAIVLDSKQQPVIRTLGIYLKKYPMALAMPGEIWVLQINHIKMTDNTLGFGKKIVWDRTQDLPELISG